MQKLTFLATAVLIGALLYPATVYSQSSSELEYRKYRVTLVPGLSTNGVDAYRYNARYSLNILAGYHGGLEGYELGFVNINRKFSRGVQVGGLNATGGEMSGVQIASFGNLSSGEQQGVQISGIGNLSGQNMQGVQISGLGNISATSMRGVQITGGVNIGSEIQGIQIGGIGNFSRGAAQGLQFSGITNISGGSAQGLMFSGITNISGASSQGLHFAGVANIASGTSQGFLFSGVTNISDMQQGIIGTGVVNISRQFQGIQFAGVANIAETGQGVQIGLFNTAREFEGIPVGLISYYGNGRKNLDVWFTDGGFTHLGMNLGMHDIYNKLSVGFNPFIPDRNVWALSWSIGTYRTLEEAWNRPKLQDYFSTHDFTIQRIFDDKWSSTTNAIFSYKYLLGKNLTSKTSLYVGPSLNLQISKQPGNSDYTWYNITESAREDRDVRFWVGFTAGVRLFGQ